MDLTGVRAGFALTGSFCTLKKTIAVLPKLVAKGMDILPLMSEKVVSTDTRFGTAEEFRKEVEEICGKKIISTIKDAEPIGPKNLVDIMIVAPCTGNTLSKIAGGITDSAVAMAVKASLRNGNPLLLAISTNDGLAGSARNIGQLLNTKNVFFVPFGQDAPIGKPTSLVADMNYLPKAAEAALSGEQIQPILLKTP